MLKDLFPAVADNRYRGRAPGLWLFALLTAKFGMGLNVMLNAPKVAEAADGIPVSSFGATAASAFLFVFAAWGLGQLLLGVGTVIVLVRYRSLVPLMFLVMLVEQVGRKLLHQRWAAERVGTQTGLVINGIFIGVIVVGLVLSLWRRREGAAEAESSGTGERS